VTVDFAAGPRLQWTVDEKSVFKGKKARERKVRLFLRLTADANERLRALTRYHGDLSQYIDEARGPFLYLLVGLTLDSACAWQVLTGFSSAGLQCLYSWFRAGCIGCTGLDGIVGDGFFEGKMLRDLRDGLVCSGASIHRFTGLGEPTTGLTTIKSKT
jgi:hypothetical protein